MMLGAAKLKFMEMTTTSPWKGLNKNKAPWPFLDLLLKQELLSYVDIALAERLLQQVPLATEAMASCICHLSLAARQGHLCVHISENTLFPSAEMVWLPSADLSSDPKEEMTDETFDQLTTLIVTGANTLTTPLIEEMSDDNMPLLSSTIPSSPICRQSNRYYLQRYFVLESLFLKQLAARLAEKDFTLPVDKGKVHTLTLSLKENNKLLEEQASAVIQGCLNPLTLIIGGPGTGKTHTAGVLLRVLWESLSADSKTQCRIALAAPTGKAAANLESSIRRALKDVEGFSVPTAKTLHALLGIGKRIKQGESTTLPYDLLLIDESSMIDARMMERLFASVKPGARLIMLGDRYQLPPIEAGSLFGDLVTCLQEYADTNPSVTELKTCLRAEIKAIVDVAGHINLGEEQQVMTLLKKGSQVVFTPLSKTENAKDHQARLLTHCKDKFPAPVSSLENPIKLMQAFAQFRILTPLRIGPLGVEALNALFLQAAIRCAQAAKTPLFVAPIMIVQNDHRLELFNGEVGILVRPLFNESMVGSYALFPSKAPDTSQEGMRKLSLLVLPSYEYAYCLSVHKSQGSEFDHVLMLLPEGSSRFGREVLYTGVTRAKKALEIWSEEEVFKMTLEQVSKRNSGVRERFSPLFLKSF